MWVSLFPVLPDVANVKNDLFAWGAAFVAVLLALFVFAAIAPLVLGGEREDDAGPEEDDDD